MPPQRHDTENEAGLRPQRELDLRLVTRMLVEINIKLDAHDSKFTKVTPCLLCW